jgi:predicted ATPase
MKIDYLQINSRFKNLDQVRIEFDEDELMTVVVGLNGSGKSNVLEALVSIFRNLDLGESPLFAYEIQYKLSEGDGERWIKVTADPTWGESVSKQYKIACTYNRLQNSSEEITWQDTPISKVVRDKDGYSAYLPRHLFAYYSGPSDRLENYFKKHRTNFYRMLLNNQIDLRGEIRPLFYAKPIHSQFVLLAFFLGDNNAAELDFLYDQLGIEGLDSVHFVFRQPSWTKSSNRNELFWGARGVVREFIERVFPNSLAPIKLTRNEDVTLTGTNIQNEFFHLFLSNLDALRKVAGDLSADVFFKMLESTLLSDMLSEVRVRVKVRNFDYALSFRELSEGEQQLLTVLGLLKFTGEKDSLFLLDEPDTHLNPAWSVKYLSFLKNFVPNPKTSHVIMITHSPLAIAELQKEQVQVMWRDDLFKVYSDKPEDDPRGMGYAGILTSDMFRLDSTLDEHTKNLIRERQEILEKHDLNSADNDRLDQLNKEIESLGFSSVHWDTQYGEYLRLRKEIYPQVFSGSANLTPDLKRARKKKAQEIIQIILEKESKE